MYQSGYETILFFIFLLYPAVLEATIRLTSGISIIWPLMLRNIIKFMRQNPSGASYSWYEGLNSRGNGPSRGNGLTMDGSSDRNVPALCYQNQTISGPSPPLSSVSPLCSNRQSNAVDTMGNEVVFAPVGVLRRNSKVSRVLTRIGLCKSNVAFEVTLYAPKMRIVETLRALLTKIADGWCCQNHNGTLSTFHLKTLDNGDMKLRAFLAWTEFLVTFWFKEVSEEIDGQKGCHVVCYPSKWQTNHSWLKKKVVVANQDQERSLYRCLSLLKMATESVNSRVSRSNGQ